MGILKKCGSWKTNKHERRVVFGKEYSSIKGSSIKNIKLHDGMSEKNRAWFNFLDLSIILQLDPEIAWERVPMKYLDFVWNTLLDVLDIYCNKGSFVACPLGHPRCAIIGATYADDINIVSQWAYGKIHKRETLVENKENYYMEPEEDVDWKYLKEIFNTKK
tara:strand:+ start:3285 stop:3770 length:486 start_codon:yes stop_codon:yes gene_type:complete